MYATAATQKEHVDLGATRIIFSGKSLKIIGIQAKNSDGFSNSLIVETANGSSELFRVVIFNARNFILPVKVVIDSGIRIRAEAISANLTCTVLFQGTP
jgi:hypothetical protein